MLFKLPGNDSGNKHGQKANVQGKEHKRINIGARECKHWKQRTLALKSLGRDNRAIRKLGHRAPILKGVRRAEQVRTRNRGDGRQVPNKASNVS